jgi:F0F1-type ATP synthase membrane subunit c/vacuolar-type H+-ATPase subunit K
MIMRARMAFGWLATGLCGLALVACGAMDVLSLSTAATALAQDPDLDDAGDADAGPPPPN